MLTIYRRAANDLDLKAVKLQRGSLGRNLVTVLVPTAAVAFVVAYAISRSLWTASVIAAVLCFASLFSNLRFFRNVRRREALKNDVNSVEVFEVFTSSVVDVEPLGDDAPAYCFFLDDGTALLLVGQWLLDYDSFPAESFRLHRWADTKKPIRIDVTGQPLTAAHSTARLKSIHRFGKIEVLVAKRETLQDDLDGVVAHEK